MRAAYLVLVAFALVGCFWNIPCFDTWAADSVSPRVSGLGSGLAETYAWGSHFTYPPLHLIVLGVLALPAIAVGALRAPHGPDALRLTLMHAPYMTWFEITSRAVTLVMALGVIRNVSRSCARLWDMRVARIAALVIACNPVFVYYAHTGNLEIPALFWATWSLDEMVRVSRGEARELHAVLLAVAAALTKDQAIALLAIPLAAMVTSRRAWRALAMGAATYGALSGALVNPLGFARRVAFLVGPASQDWTPYPATVAGFGALAVDAARCVVSFGGLVAFVFACVGIARARREGWIFAASAIAFTGLVTLGARRSEERFLLPQSIVLAPYVGVAIVRIGERVRGALVPLVCATLAWPAWEAVRVDATLIADARVATARYLRALPANATIELFGDAGALPHVPDSQRVDRYGDYVVLSSHTLDDFADRTAMSAPHGREPRSCPRACARARRLGLRARRDISLRASVWRRVPRDPRVDGAHDLGRSQARVSAFT